MYARDNKRWKTSNFLIFTLLSALSSFGPEHTREDGDGLEIGIFRSGFHLHLWHKRNRLPHNIYDVPAFGTARSGGGVEGNGTAELWSSRIHFGQILGNSQKNYLAANVKKY